MPVMYNLRSSQRRKGISDRNCYLQNYVAKQSPEAFNPKVCLERLKLLDCSNIQNSRFYLRQDRITIKQERPKKPNKRYFLKFFCSIILIVLCMIYYKDKMQFYRITIAKKFDEIHPAIKNYFMETVELKKNFLKLLTSTERDVSNKNVNKKSAVSKKHFIVNSRDDLEITKLVEDEFIGLESGDKFKNSTNVFKSFIEEQCKAEINDNLKTFYEESNLTDYALESLGAEIVTVFDTEPYGIKTINILNFNIWPPLAHFLMTRFKYFSKNDANSILTPWKKPGDCWAFKGSRGRVQIKLSDKIFITAVTVDHIPKELTLAGNIDSAPKKFSLVGIEEPGAVEAGTDLGTFEYKKTGPSTQTFLLETKWKIPFRWIEVKIESNHGNVNYTCLYKIRIHGHK